MVTNDMMFGHLCQHGEVVIFKQPTGLHRISQNLHTFDPPPTPGHWSVFIVFSIHRPA
jgi:hypothetical protein